LVAAVSSGQRLYLVLEGPALPPPRFKGALDQPELLSISITTPSGLELFRGAHWNNGKEGRRPRTFFVDAQLPPDPSEPLTVQLRREDGSIIWEVQAVPTNNA
jgi:hypothetical protein